MIHCNTSEAVVFIATFVVEFVAEESSEIWKEVWKQNPTAHECPRHPSLVYRLSTATVLKITEW